MSDEDNALVKVDELLLALRDVMTCDECKKIKDKAEAARYYARSVGMSIDTQNDLFEVTLAAMARAGELLREMAASGERAKKGGDQKSSAARELGRLADLDITKKQSSLWQRVAKVPEEKRREYVAKMRDADTLATLSGFLKSTEHRDEHREKQPPIEPDEPDFEPDEECIFAIQGIINKAWGTLTQPQKLSVGRYFQTQAERIMREVGDGR